jgi:hypothetical protein
VAWGAAANSVVPAAKAIANRVFFIAFYILLGGSFSPPTTPFCGHALPHTIASVG